MADETLTDALLQQRGAVISEKMYAAIGRLVVTWAALESGLPLVIAQLIAWTEHGAVSATVYVKAILVVSGSDPNAMLAQIKTLTSGFTQGPEIAKAAEKLRALKGHRDEVCHWLTAAGGAPDKVTIKLLSGSRAKMWQEKHYSAKQLEEWREGILKNASAIYRLTSDLTGVTQDQISKSLSQSDETPPPKADEIPAT